MPNAGAGPGGGKNFFDIIRPLKLREAAQLVSIKEELEERCMNAPAPLSLSAALGERDPAIIAEVKRASPSRGVFAAGLDAAKQARMYVRGGASAISVLTEPRYFHGSLQDLEKVRQAVGVPVLRKDFILDPLQVTAARAAGADAVLLIVGFLRDAGLLARLRAHTESLGMEALVEVHNEEELREALGCGAKLIGINNRDLETLAVDLATGERLLKLVPPEVTVVIESGIHGREDLKRLRRAGARAFLIGEHLVRSADPERALRELTDIQGRTP